MTPKKFFCFALTYTISLGLSAQIKEMEELWKNQKIEDRQKLTKPMYLEISKEEILDLFNKQPSFGLYKDNYFITGGPVNKKITNHTADAKYQLSIQQRLTKTVLPFNTFLMLTYTQKSFWDIYENSSPFKDNNYNPGLTLAKPIVSKNRLKGMATFAFEHESNGRDGKESRSWNYFTFSGVYFFNMNFTFQTKLWGGWLGSQVKDLYKYRGYGLLALNHKSPKDKYWISAIINPCQKIKRINTLMEFNLKLNPRSNQYFFIQWYHGYGESLLEYDKYNSMVRLGICIKPPLRNLY